MPVPDDFLSRLDALSLNILNNENRELQNIALGVFFESFRQWDAVARATHFCVDEVHSPNCEYHLRRDCCTCVAELEKAVEKLRDALPAVQEGK